MNIYIFALVFFIIGILTGYGIGLHPGKNFLERTKNWSDLRKTFYQRD